MQRITFAAALVLALIAAVPRAGRVPAADPVPVLLVPGWSDDADELDPLAQRFIEAGWPGAHVRTLSFDDPFGSNRDHAREIARALAELRRDTGTPHVDVVAHSMGGLAVRHHLAMAALDGSGGAGVRRVVFLATPHAGTWSALVAWGDGAGEMLPGSDFLGALMRRPPIPDGIEALTVRTPIDLHILPQESASLPGVPDRELCCPTHAGLVDDPRVFALVKSFLETGVVE